MFADSAGPDQVRRIRQETRHAGHDKLEICILTGLPGQLKELGRYIMSKDGQVQVVPYFMETSSHVWSVEIAWALQCQ